MRSRSTRVALACVVALVSAIASAGPAEAGKSSGVLVSGKEYRLTLSRASVSPGKLRVEFDNFGEDDHDLAIMRRGTSKVYYLPTVHPGDRAVKNITTRKGSYVMWCTISDHKARGMRAVLRVKK
jgi:plastocyanin